MQLTLRKRSRKHRGGGACAFGFIGDEHSAQVDKAFKYLWLESYFLGCDSLASFNERFQSWFV
jgi:hypothetical protein